MEKTCNLEHPKIIALTPHWLVVSKPSGWLTIPGRNSPDRDAPNGQSPMVLSEWATQTYSSIWIVHRLDRETSGVVLLARTAEDHKKANSWFQERKMKKIYHCLASGVPATPILKINDPIEGVHAVTQVEVKESFQEGFLAQVVPRTGRRNQIRIHLAYRNHPIWGDVKYRGASEIVFEKTKLPIQRVALHASSLELPTGEIFKDDFPEDFSNWLNVLRKEGSRV